MRGPNEVFMVLAASGPETAQPAPWEVSREQISQFPSFKIIFQDLQISGLVAGHSSRLVFVALLNI